MKVQFYTTKENKAAFESDLAPFARKSDATISVRDHKKNAALVVVEVANRYDQIQPNFERYLKMRESQGMLKTLKIEA